MSINIIEDHWEDFKAVADTTLMMTECYNCIVLYWMLGDDNKTTEWLSRILDFSHTNKRPDLIFASRLMQMPIACDLDPNKLSNYIENTSKWLRSKNNGNEFSKIVLKQFRVIDKRLEMKAAISVIKKASQQSYLGLEEMLMWSNAKLSGKSLKMVFIEMQENNFPKN